MKESKKIFVAIVFLLTCTFACKKNVQEKSSITGLWVGSYTFKSQPPLFFSFTIYHDGTMSYKCKGINDYIFYANGNWSLNNNKLTYTVTTTNTPGVSVQPVQSGSATYSENGTLTNGVNMDVASGDSGNFNMTRVN